MVANTQHDFKDTLKSVAFADEIIVVDMHSTDKTREVAGEFTDKIFTYEDVGFVEPARNYAINKASSDWVLIIDADEVISKKLKKKILELIKGDATADAYHMPRKNIVFGHWYQHAGWWPDYQLRLFKKGAIDWPKKIHAQPEITGAADHLAPREEYAITHYNYQSVSQFVERLNRYTSHEAEQREQLAVTEANIVRAFDAELMSRMFLHRGLDAGTHGVGISFLQSFYEVVVTLKQWESQGFPESKDTEDAAAQLEKLHQHLGYWLADWHSANSTGISKLVWKLRRKLGV